MAAARMTPRLRVILVVGGVLIAVALLWRAWLQRDEGPVVTTVPSDSTVTGLRSTPLWFASADGESLVVELRETPEQPDLHGRVAALVEALASGPQGDGVRVLPVGTRLLHAYLDERGTLTLDLSRAFRQGFRGGARTEELALGSLVRTVATAVPEARRIRLVCAGAPLATLGGHFPLDEPLDPDDWP